MSDLYVNEIFYSIQGEGSHTGLPAVFVRLQGCSVRCDWCDTKYTWKKGDECRIIPIHDVFVKDRKPHCTKISPNDLVVEIIRRFPFAPLVILTGGEPCEQDIAPLCRLLLDGGFKVAVETSGTQPLGHLPEKVFVTISPKIHAEGGKLADGVLEQADELKYVIGDENDIAEMRHIVSMMNRETRICLQPRSLSPEATALCVDEVKRQGGRFMLSLQTEKFANIR